MTRNWKAWFDGYARDAAHEDPRRLAARYAPSFLVAAPAGSATFSNDAAFLKWLRGVRKANLAAGLVRMRVANARETRLGDAFSMVKVTWEARFHKTGNKPILFEISYLVSTGRRPQVLAYVSHVDEDAAKRRAGLS